MFVLLSSGASERYRQDVLRAIALPRGAQLQFRYDLRWIAPEIKSLLSENRVKNTPSLIAYIDQRDPGKAPVLIPCRLATVVSAETHGTTSSLILSLAEFGLAEDIESFNDELRSMCSTLPSWGLDGKIKGTYWSLITNTPNSVSRSEGLDYWEKLVAQLYSHADFSSEPFFYTVRGLYQVSQENPLRLREGIYTLKPGQTYELQLYHFHPKADTSPFRLRVNATSDSIVFTQNPVLYVDSRYDLKHIRFKTSRPVRAQDFVLSVNRLSESQPEPGAWMFDLCARIKGTFWGTLLKGLVIGVFLALTQIISAKSGGSPTALYLIITAVLALITGIVAAFGLRETI